MPASRRTQSNTLLYAMIAFLVIAVVAIVVAVIYYVKHEDQRTAALDAQQQLSEVATSIQYRNMAKNVGTKKRGETYLGNTIDYIHQMIAMVSGGPLPEDVSAQDLVAQSLAKVEEALAQLASADIQLQSVDANSTGLTAIIGRLSQKLQITKEGVLDLTNKLNDASEAYDLIQKTSYAKEQELSEEVANYRKQVNIIKKDYDELQALLKADTSQQIQSLNTELQKQKALQQRTHSDLLKNRAQLQATQAKLQQAQLELRKILAPAIDVAAFEPDGKIILVDNQVVHINIGKNNRVYPGLTFAVYDKSVPVPEDGRGKAEIKVFDIQENVAAARVINIQPGTGIVVDDLIANLIWDADKQSIFVIAGDFDLNKNTEPDFDAFDRLKTMIEQWGGKIAEMVSINTDFVILGDAPRVFREPTLEDLEIDPTAAEKYIAAKKRRDYYDMVKKEAEALWVPVFNTDRFFYFIGYKTLSAKPDAL